MNKLSLLSLLWALAIVHPWISSAQTSTKWAVELAMNMTSPDSLKKLFSDIQGLSPEKIEEARKNFNDAYIRLEKNPHFPKTWVSKEILFALMLKESMFNNGMTSSSGAVGYFQLKPDAVKDAEAFMHSKLGIRGKKYDVTNATDNCILGIVYYTFLHEKVSTLSERFDIDDAYSHLLTVASYNLWVGNLGKLLTIYDVETSVENFNWDEFVKWVLKKEWGGDAVAQERNDPTYKVVYRDWFNGQDFSKSEEIVKFSSTLSLRKSKIQEFINYVEKIDAIAKKKEPIISETKPLEKEEIQTTRVVGDTLYIKLLQKENHISFLKRYGFSGPLALWVFYDINASTFEWTWLLPQQTPEELPQWGEYKLPVIAYKVQAWENLSVILGKKWVPQKYIQKVIDFNKIYRDWFSEKTVLQVGEYIYIPLWKTGFYSDGITDETPAEIKKREEEKKKQLEQEKKELWKKQWEQKQLDKIPNGKFDFYEWIKTIEVKSDKLKWKVFILDPGHWARDLWSVVKAIGGDWNLIPDEKSMIRQKTVKDKNGYPKIISLRVPNSESDKVQFIIEATVVLDVTYRLAKQIIENWWEVEITRYSKSTGIDESTNPPLREMVDDILSDSKKTWDYPEDNNKKRLYRGSDIARNIVQREGNKGKDVFFFSIHADSSTVAHTTTFVTREFPITFMYNKDKKWFSAVSKDFCEKLARNTTFRWNQAETRSQQLYPVNTSYSWVEYSTLIELANLANPASSYLLRVPEWRQRFADAIFEGIEKSLWRK